MNQKHKRLQKIFLGVAAFALFQKKLKDDNNIFETIREAAETTDFSRIRCPLCSWQPRASSRWFCTDAGFPENYFGGCGTMWNTFATKGVCPGCAHQWLWTSCLACYKMSPHKDWYVEKSA